MRELVFALVYFLGFATLLAGVIEMALSAAWIKSYFTMGLPIFTWRVPAVPQRPNPLSIAELESHFRDGWPPLVFGKLDPHAYGFREKLFAFSTYTPIMHGLVAFDYDRREVVVTGFANLTTVLFNLARYVGLLPGLTYFSPPLLLFFIAPLFIWGSIYAIQFYRYRNVALWAGRGWSQLR